MKKRLNRLIERECGFHDVIDGYGGNADVAPRSTLDTSSMGRGNTIHQIWENGKKVDSYKKIDSNWVLSFSPGIGYNFIGNTEHENEIGTLEYEIKEIEGERFRVSPKIIEELCKTIKEINHKAGVDNLNYLNFRGIKKRLGKEAVFYHGSVKIYLLPDGTGAYTGRKENLPTTRGIDMISIRQDGKFYSNEFRDYLKKKNMQLDIKFGKNERNFPNAMLWGNDGRMPNKNDLLRIITENELPALWDVSEEHTRYNGEHFQLTDHNLGNARGVIYRNATNFNRVYLHSLRKDIHVEIPRDYKYDLDTHDTHSKIIKKVEHSLDGKYDFSYFHIFNVNGEHKKGSLNKFENDREFRYELMGKIEESTKTPSLEGLGGGVKILSHCPYLKINGADTVYGKPPKSPTHEINTYSGIHSTTEVIYDF